MRILQLLLISISFAATASNYPITHTKEMQEAVTQIHAEEILAAVTTLTNFPNRSATQETGLQTAIWLHTQVTTMVTLAGNKDCDIYYVPTGGRYIQPSVVLKIGKHLHAPGVVLGAHMDTFGNSETERMPGAGDDASGSAALLEVARILLNSPNSIQKPIYFIWYAAEERGLVGSKQVVQYFKKNNIKIDAVMQFDMTGFRNAPEDATIWLYEDYTNKQLTAFLEDLITTYLKVPVKYSRCGYGCSDHVSWTLAGIPAAFPCEASFEQHNPYIHTALDTIDLLNIDHMINFTKLGLAFAIELAVA